MPKFEECILKHKPNDFHIKFNLYLIVMFFFIFKNDNKIALVCFFSSLYEYFFVNNDIEKVNRTIILNSITILSK